MSDEARQARVRALNEVVDIVDVAMGGMDRDDYHGAPGAALEMVLQSVISLKSAAAPPKPSVGDTVRVRILVAVDRLGQWQTYGWFDATDETARADIYVDDLVPGERYTWVEADVPKPAADVVEGDVLP